MRNSATNFENWRRKISYQTRNFRNGTRKISGNIDLGCAVCKLSSLGPWEEMNLPVQRSKGAVIIYGGGWHRREMFFVAKILLTQLLKRQKFDYPTSNIN